jgi:hypothetical protein
MCPMCVGAIAATAVKAGSAGGILAFVVARVRRWVLNKP